MSLDINKYLATNTRALVMGNQRMELLASNMANSDTPGYKARDIDFKAAMQSAGSQDLQQVTTRSGHIRATAGPNQATAMYRVPVQPSLDGNTVDAQLESAAIAETSVRYQATLTFLNAQIGGIKLAITGRR